MFAEEFDERTAANMELAPEGACQRLPVDRSDHQPRRFIAEKIIECARSGNTTLSELTAAGIKAMPADGGDYTVNVVVGLDAEGRMHLLDLWRRRAAADQWVEAFCDLVGAWRPIGWAEEQGQIRSGVRQFSRKAHARARGVRRAPAVRRARRRGRCARNRCAAAWRWRDFTFRQPRHR